MREEAQSYLTEDVFAMVGDFLAGLRRGHVTNVFVIWALWALTSVMDESDGGIVRYLVGLDEKHGFLERLLIRMVKYAVANL